MKKVVLLLISLLLVKCEPYVIEDPYSDGDDYIMVLPNAGENYTNANFALHLPPGNSNIKGILVIVPGYNSDGRYYKDEPEFRDFAEQNHLAIVSCYFEGDENLYSYYANAGLGSGEALLRAIHAFATRNERPELERVPFVMWGHSAGGMFSYAFTCWKPERVAACTPVRSSEFTEIPTDTSKLVPTLFVVGQFDLESWNAECINFCNEYRKTGALWAYAIEQDIGHGIGRSLDISLPYLNEVLNLRLPYGNTNYESLLPMVEENGWLGNYVSKTVTDFQTYPEAKEDAAWLPSENTANLWAEFVNSLRE